MDFVNLFYFYLNGIYFHDFQLEFIHIPGLLQKPLKGEFAAEDSPASIQKAKGLPQEHTPPSIPDRIPGMKQNMGSVGYLGDFKGVAVLRAIHPASGVSTPWNARNIGFIVPVRGFQSAADDLGVYSQNANGSMV